MQASGLLVGGRSQRKNICDELQPQQRDGLETAARERNDRIVRRAVGQVSPPHKMQVQSELINLRKFVDTTGSSDHSRPNRETGYEGEVDQRH